MAAYNDSLCFMQWMGGDFILGNVIHTKNYDRILPN